MLGNLPQGGRGRVRQGRAAGGDRRPGALAAGGLGAALALVEPLGLIRDGWNGFNVLHTAAARMAALMLGFAQPGGIADLEAASPSFVACSAPTRSPPTGSRALLRSISATTATRARAADLILPGAAYAEKHGTYVNIEGRVQRGEKALVPAGRRARGLVDLPRRRELAGKRCRSTALASCARRCSPISGSSPRRPDRAPWAPPKLDAKARGPIAYPIEDFYLTNAIARNRPTLQRCSDEMVHGGEFQEAAE